MSADRLRSQAMRWGWLVLACGAWYLWESLAELDAELLEMAGLLPLIRYAERLSQLRPAMFKFPWAGVYLGLFVGLTLAAAGWCVFLGLRSLLEPQLDPERTSDEDTRASG